MDLPEDVPYIYHTYKRYSLGTRAVVQWLCMNAESCGHQLSPPKPTSKSGIKKARAKAKKNPVSNKIYVPVSEYLTLAKIIVASSQPQTQVPSWVIYLLSDMVSLRKICMEIYASSVTGNNDIANGSGENPSSLKIGILEEVLRVLESRRLKDDQDSPIHLFSEAHTFRENLFSKNPYDRLFPDEPVKAGENWQQCLLPKNSLFVPLSDHEEEMLRLQCFLEDYHSTRRFLRRCWEAYRREETDLYAVSVVTNTAIQYLQEMLSDITQTQSGGPMSYVQFLALAADSLNSSAEIFNPFFALGSLPIDKPVWDKAEKICLPAYCILEQFRMDPPKSYKSSCLSHDEAFLETGTEPATIYNRFKGILNHFLGELWFLNNSRELKRHIPCEDMLTMGVFKLLGGHGVPHWLPFACTIYLDIHEALGTDLRAGNYDLLLSCERISRTLQDFLRFPNILDVVPEHVPDPKNVTKPDEQQTRSYQRRISDSEKEAVPVDEHVMKVMALIKAVLWVQSDSIKPVRDGARRMLGLKSPEAEGFHLFKLHPLLCGVIDFHFTLKMQHTSIQAINDWGAILSVTYLYSTIQNEVPNGFSRWKDMELFNWMHFEDIGGRPRNAAELMTLFEENIGFRASDFNQPLPRGPIPSDLFRPKSQVSSLLFEHYGNRGALDFANFGTEWRWTQRTFLTPERLCLELALGLKFEFCALKLNYLNLHMRCSRMLHKIHWSLHDKFVARYGEGYIESRQQLPFLVGYLLFDLSMHGAVKKMRDDEQRMCQYRESDVTSNSDIAEVEEYESARGNNEVYEYKSAPSSEIDVFEDYESRDPRCTVVVTGLLYQAGELIDNFVCREGDWEHQALESIKDSHRVNPALLEAPLPTMGDMNDDFRHGWLQQ